MPLSGQARWGVRIGVLEGDDRMVLLSLEGIPLGVARTRLFIGLWKKYKVRP